MDVSERLVSSSVPFLFILYRTGLLVSTESCPVFCEHSLTPFAWVKKKQTLQMSCLVPVRRFLSPSRPIHSGDALAARGTRQADAYFPFANGRFHFYCPYHHW